MQRQLLAVGILLALASACSGGNTSVLPGATRTQGQSATATLTISIPSASTTSSKQHRAYVSSGTQSIIVQPYPESIVSGLWATGPAASPVTVNVSSCPLVGGVATCSIPLSLAAGDWGIDVSAYSAINGGGALLSTGNDVCNAVASCPNVFTITLGATNTLALDLGGVLSTVSIAQNALLRDGSSSTATITWTPTDASGATIVGSDPFASAQPFSCAALAPLSSSFCTAPTWSSPTSGESATVQYDGTSILSATGPFPTLASTGTVPFSFTPAVDVGMSASSPTVTMPAPPSTQTISISGAPVTSAVLLGCPAGVTIGSSSATSVTLDAAAGASGSCALALYGNATDNTPFSQTNSGGTQTVLDSWPISYETTSPNIVPVTAQVLVPIYVTSTTNTVGYVSPSSVEFASTSSPAQTVTVYPPSSYSGPVWLYRAHCYAVSTTSATTPDFSGQSNNTIAENKVVIVPSPSPVGSNTSAAGSPVTFTVKPKHQGVCEEYALSYRPSSGILPANTKIFASFSSAVGP